MALASEGDRITAVSKAEVASYDSEVGGVLRLPSALELVDATLEAPVEALATADVVEALEMEVLGLGGCDVEADDEADESRSSSVIMAGISSSSNRTWHSS